MPRQHRYLDDFSPKRRPVKNVEKALSEGGRSGELMAELSLAKRVGKAIQPVVAKARLALDFTDAANCRIDSEKPDRIVLFVRNTVQHGRLRNLTTSLLASIFTKGLPVHDILIRIRPRPESEAAPAAPPKPRRGSIAGAARLRAAARELDGSDKLARLFMRLAAAIEPKPEREAIDLYDSIDALIAGAKAGQLAVEQLMVRLPKAPVEKLIPSEAAAARSATVAGLRTRMLARLAARRTFETPLREAGEGLSREEKRARALLGMLQKAADAVPLPPEVEAAEAAKAAESPESPEGALAASPEEAPPSPEALARARLEAALCRLPRFAFEEIEADYLALAPEVRALLRQVTETAAALEAHEARRRREAARPIALPPMPKTPEEVRQGCLEAIQDILRSAKDARSCADAVLSRLANIPRFTDEDFVRTRTPRRLLREAETTRLGDAARMLRDAVSRFLFRLDEEKTRLLARTGDPDKIEFADAVVAFESVKANLSDKARMLGEEGETLMDRIELVEAEAQALEARLKELQEAAEARQAQLAAAAAAAPESNPSATLEAQLGAERARLAFLLKRRPKPVDRKLIPSEADAEADPMLAGVRSRMLARATRAESIDQAAAAALESEAALKEALEAGFSLDEPMLEALRRAVSALEEALSNERRESAAR